jgi:hypothetical protein
MVLKVAEPRDVISLSQASFLADSWYYTLIPQFGHFQIQSFEASIPCCGKRGRLESPAVFATNGYIINASSTTTTLPRHFYASSAKRAEPFLL